MSLINQMLRDLDQRQTAQSVQPQVAPVGTSIDATQQVQRSPRLLLWGLGICVCVGIVWAKGPMLLNQWASNNELAMSPAAEAAKPKTAPTDRTVKQKRIDVKQEDSPAKKVVAVDKPDDVQPIPQVELKPTSKPIAKVALISKDTESQGFESKHQDQVALVNAKPKEKSISKQRRMDPAEQARLKMDEAELKLQSGQISAATDALKQAVDLQASWSEPRVKLVVLYQQQGRWNEAEQLLVQALQLEPRSAYWTLMRAKNLWQQAGAVSAIKVLEKARTDKVRDLNLDLFLAALYQRSQLYQASATVYQDILSRDQQQGKAWLGLAISLQALQQPSDALAAFQQALRSGGHEPKVQQYIEQRIAALRA